MWSKAQNSERITKTYTLLKQTTWTKQLGSAKSDFFVEVPEPVK